MALSSRRTRTRGVSMTEEKKFKSYLVVGQKELIKKFEPIKDVVLRYLQAKVFISMAKPLEIVPDFDAVITSDVYPTKEDYETFEVIDAFALLVEMEKKGIIKFLGAKNVRT